MAMLRKFLAFARPRLRAAGGVDEAKLKRLRNMSDLRLQDVAVKHPNLTLHQLSKLFMYAKGAAPFSAVAVKAGMLTAEQANLPLAHDSFVIGVAEDAILIQNVMTGKSQLALMRAFLRKLEEETVPEAPPEPEPFPEFKLTRKIRTLLGEAEGLWDVRSEVDEIQKLLRTPGVVLAAVVEAVERESELAVRMLSLANAARFDTGGESFDGIGAVIEQLGPEGVVRLAPAAGIVKAFGPAPEDATFDVTDCWAHGLQVAYAATQVCRDRSLGAPDGFFIAGLLHDVGKLVVARHLKGEMKKILSAVKQGEPFAQVERSILRVDHAVIGALLCERWRLPDAEVEAARHHLEELEMLDSYEMTMEARVVGAICAAIGSRAEAGPVARFLKIGEDRVGEISREAAALASESLQSVLGLG